MDFQNLLTNGDPSARATILFAHGAGAPMDAPFMETLAQNLATQGLRVIRFEFPYMAQRRVDGKKRPPNSANRLLEAWREIIVAHPTNQPLFIAGKSMGGRLATMIADEQPVAGVICYGYPFHPPGKPEKLRTQHLENLKTPCLIVQGERDSFGTQAEVSTYSLASSISVHWLKDGDHSLKPRKSSGLTQQQHLEAAAITTAAFLDNCLNI